MDSSDHNTRTRLTLLIRAILAQSPTLLSEIREVSIDELPRFFEHELVKGVAPEVEIEGYVRDSGVIRRHRDGSSEAGTRSFDTTPLPLGPLPDPRTSPEQGKPQTESHTCTTQLPSARKLRPYRGSSRSSLTMLHMMALRA